MGRVVSICLSFFLFLQFFVIRTYAQQPAAAYEDDIAPVEITPSGIGPELYIVPAVLIGLGVLSETVPSNTALSKYEIHKRITAGERVNYLDDYLQFAPLTAVILLPLGTDIPHRSTMPQLIGKAAVSQATMLGLVYGMKEVIGKERPGGRPHSFPSGHTAQAFTGAQLLYLEYRDTNKWIAYSGYPVAAFVGVDRVVNNDHWASDVLVGAGIGMAIPVFVYWASDRIFGSPAEQAANAGKASGGYTAFLTPALRPGSHGIGVAVNF